MKTGQKFKQNQLAQEITYGAVIKKLANRKKNETFKAE